MAGPLIRVGESIQSNAVTPTDVRSQGIEAETLLAGTLLPLSHRSAWARTQPAGAAFFVPVHSAEGHLLTSAMVQRDRSRALPGHVLLRVQRFGYGWPVATWSPMMERLREIAKSDRSVLRLNLEIFLRSDREAMHELLRRNGFLQVAPRGYRHTLTLPVDQDDDALLANRKSLRKRLREVEKASAVVRVLTEPIYAQALTALQQKAMERSGGSFRVADWPLVLKFSQANPELSRVVGLFPSIEAASPQALLGFAWGCMHGDHAEYRAAGSADLGPEHKSLSISYPLLWDLIRWTRDSGGTWFDMGGVTIAQGEGDPLAGISAAKRVFSETVEEVGEEWMLEPHPWKSRLANGVGSLARKLGARE